MIIIKKEKNEKRHGLYKALVVCEDCKKERWVTDVHRAGEKCKSCSNKSNGIKKRGKGSWNSKMKFEPKNIGSAYFNTGKYIEVWIGKHTIEGKEGGYYLYHRMILEVFLKRRLKSNEIIHHLDGDELNNQLTNLCLVSNISEHRYIHDSLEKVAFELYKDGIIKFDFNSNKYYLEYKSINKIYNKDIEATDFIDQNIVKEWFSIFYPEIKIEGSLCIK